ncbi:ABC transporter [Acidihalobacter aeolianus]|uniref:ABC transporter n=1 Tax=Acidihalobacter aeolianus TaxID=2792603 RepID=A0A1D8K488_9GAMM|nr:peptidase domain-containing ABC transporter [Acidihalobacter aeolianus]AOV15773.1 ABC transporter [Acidihalobacter aeolianus]
MKSGGALLGGLRFGFGRRVPVVLQSEAAECGLACLAMVAGYHGYETDLGEMRRRFTASLKGMHLSRLMQVAAELRLDARAVRLELDELARLRLPCILHWDMNHFVVLTDVDRNGATIIDPAHGRLTLPLSEVSEAFTGVALELVPAANFEPAARKPSVSLRALAGSVEGLRSALLRVFALALVLEVLGILGPFYMQWVLDEVLVINDHSLLTLLGLGFLAVTLFTAAFSVLRSWVILYVNATLGVQWATNAFAHLMKLPLDFFERRHIGDVVSRYGAIQNIRQTITTELVSAVLDGIMASALLIVMSIYSLELTAVAIGILLLYLLLRWVAYEPLRAATERHIYAGATQQSHLLEAIRGVQALKRFNADSARTARFGNLLVETTNQQIREQQLSILFGAAQHLLLSAGHVAVIWLAALQVMHGGFTIGMLVAYAAYASQFIGRGDGLINAWISFRMLRLYGERLADIALAAPEKNVESTYLGPDPAPHLLAKNLAYRYGADEPWVLEDVSFELAPGESLAVVGLSGCGKSTLVKLLLGLLTAERGELLMGEVDVRQLGLRRYRALVGSVMQADTLFAGTLADNIALANPEASLDDIVAASRAAAVHDEIAALPMGYQSLVGDMGSVLSGGQQQRVLLARALLAKPRVLVLDEATSHLDSLRERQVNDNLRALGITRVVIAHRWESIVQCDRIMRLSDGRLKEVSRQVLEGNLLHQPDAELV